MGLCYASITGTSVVQLKDVPPRPKEYDGMINLYGVLAATRRELKRSWRQRELSFKILTESVGASLGGLTVRFKVRLRARRVL